MNKICVLAAFGLIVGIVSIPTPGMAGGISKHVATATATGALDDINFHADLQIVPAKGILRVTVTVWTANLNDTITIVPQATVSDPKTGAVFAQFVLPSPQHGTSHTCAGSCKVMGDFWVDLDDPAYVAYRGKLFDIQVIATSPHANQALIGVVAETIKH